jgi:hypothetical protein
MKTFTVIEIANIFKVQKRTASGRLRVLALAGKATQLNPKIGPNNPAVYQLHIPLRDVFMTQSDAMIARNNKVNYKKFCSDPFNLGLWARPK